MIHAHCKDEAAEDDRGRRETPATRREAGETTSTEGVAPAGGHALKVLAPTACLCCNCVNQARLQATTIRSGPPCTSSCCGGSRFELAMTNASSMPRLGEVRGDTWLSLGWSPVPLRGIMSGSHGSDPPQARPSADDVAEVRSLVGLLLGLVMLGLACDRRQRTTIAAVAAAAPPTPNPHRFTVRSGWVRRHRQSLTGPPARRQV
jgi:hypothetical protein